MSFDVLYSLNRSKKICELTLLIMILIFLFTLSTPYHHLLSQRSTMDNLIGRKSGIGSRVLTKWARQTSVVVGIMVYRGKPS